MEVCLKFLGSSLDWQAEWQSGWDVVITKCLSVNIANKSDMLQILVRYSV